MINLLKLKMYLITRNYCFYFFVVFVLLILFFLSKFSVKEIENITFCYNLFKNIQNHIIKKELTVGIISNENYEYIDKFEKFLKENNIKIKYFNNSSEIKNSENIIDFNFEIIINKKKIMNKEDEIEIYFNYSNNILEEIVPPSIIPNELVPLQLLITYNLSSFSNITNIPTIKICSLINNKKFRALIIIFYDIIIYFYVFFFIFSNIIIEKKEHTFDFLSSQGITFDNNNLSWFFIFLIHFLFYFLISFSNVNLYEDNKLKMLINQLSFNIDIFFIYSFTLIFI